MGLKDWLAKNVAGVSTYGEVMGRECVKNGIALGRTLYLGHGTRIAPSDRFVFKDDEEMKSNGFELYCKDPLNRPAMEDSSELSKQTRTVGIAFATQLCLTASSNFMRNDTNRGDFFRSLGASTKAEVAVQNSGIEMNGVMHFLKLPSAEGTSKVLDTNNSGTGDTLGAYLQDLSKQANNSSVAFQQKGVLGFDIIAVPLAQETVLKIREACEKFRW
jgi:hypothetical protein